MKLETVKDDLWSIGMAYPHVAGLLRKPIKEGSSTKYGLHWAKLLADANLDADHFSNVCFEYANLERRLPEDLSQLPFAILEEVKQRMWKDQEQLRVYELRQQARKMPWRDGKNRVPFCQAIRYITTYGPLPDDKVEELCQWDRGGPQPEWMVS